MNEKLRGIAKSITQTADKKGARMSEEEWFAWEENIKKEIQSLYADKEDMELEDIIRNFRDSEDRKRDSNMPGAIQGSCGVNIERLAQEIRKGYVKKDSLTIDSERYIKAFKHTHVTNHKDDTCAECGLDLRDRIHRRFDENCIKEK